MPTWKKIAGWLLGLLGGSVLFLATMLLLLKFRRAEVPAFHRQ